MHQEGEPGQSEPRPISGDGSPPTGAPPLGITCGSCGWSSTIDPPDMSVPPNPDGTRSPLLFALKCPSRLPDAPVCKRVRVFSTLRLEGEEPAVTEFSPIIKSYPFISEMFKVGGPARAAARFLVFACDLYMVGRLELDPQARDAAYVGASVQLRKAAEVFLARCVLRVGGSIPRVEAMMSVLESHLPPTVSTLYDRRRVRNDMRFVLDVGDIHAHPDPSARRLRHKRYHRPATRGTIEKCLARFEQAVTRVAWDL